MIKLNKLPKPNLLAMNEEKWTEEYIRYKSGDSNVPDAARFRYRAPEIKQTLRKEASDKCIFCESKISHIFPGETDHIIPASKKVELVVNWENLGYVCKECNRFKSDFHDEQTPLLNPFEDDPDDHLIFFGPLVLAKPNKPRGKITSSLLQLSRAALVERKKDKIEKIQALLDSVEKLESGDAKKYLVSEVKSEACSNKEYSATIQAYLSVIGY